MHKRLWRRIVSVLLVSAMAAGMISPTAMAENISDAMQSEAMESSQLPDAESLSQTENAVEPEGEAQPENTVKPEEKAQLEDTAKPEGEAQPENTAKPEEKAQLENTAKPEGEAQPENTAKPQDEAQPEDTAEPKAEVPSEDQTGGTLELVEDAVQSEQLANAIQPDTSEELALPADTRPLTSIMAVDDAENPQIYTTLYDENSRVISTNDPTEKQDDDYANGGTVNLNSAVHVRFRLAEIMPHDGENGIQENVAYVLDLPSELIPNALDEDGQKIVNPEKPIEFFKTSGSLKAYGGIYTTDEGNYQVKIFFLDVEDEIDISGSFQYGATVSETLTPGETYELSNIPGGKLRFTVTPEEEPVISDGYSLSLSGGQGGATSYYWQAQIDRKEDATGDELPFTEMTITSDDAVGVWVNENDGKNLGIFNAYGDNSGPRFQLNVTYTTQGEDGKSVDDSIIAYATNVVETSENDGTTVHFTGIKGDLQVNVKFLRSDAVEGTQSIYNNKYSYITNKIHVSITNGKGNPAKNIKSLSLSVPTITYDDYEHTGSVSYKGELSVNDTVSGETIEPIEPVVCTFDIKYSSPSAGICSGAYSSDPTTSYEYLPARYYSYIYSDSSYKGNYYWMEYDPATANTLGANYYISNKTFLDDSKSQLADMNKDSYNGQKATFSSQNAGTAVSGLVNAENWTYLGRVSVAQVQGDSNLIADVSAFNKEYVGDAKFQYQLKEVFKDASGDGQLVIYRSTEKNKYGKYVYLVVDPQTYATAEKANANGWYEYMEKDNGSAKPASWRIHIFNAPQSKMLFSMFPSLGAFSVRDSEGSGSITDQVKVGIANTKNAIDSNTGTYEPINKYQSSLMNARWVDDHTIFWTMTFDASNWPKWEKGYLYAKVDSSQYPGSRYTEVTIDGQKLSSSGLYALQGSNWVNIQSGSIKTFTGPFTGSGSINALNGDTSLTAGNNETIYGYSYCCSEMTRFRNSSNDITVGFFTHVEGTPNQKDKSNSYYSCTAEFLTQSGDVSLFAGSDGNSFPASYAGKDYQYPFRVTASAKAGVPELTKTGTAVEGNSDKTTINWTVTPTFPEVTNGHTSSPIVNDFYGGYSGVLSVTDGMGAASIKDTSGNEVNDVKPGKYTYVTKIFTDQYPSISGYGGYGCGPLPYLDSNGRYCGGDSAWCRYVNGEWKETSTSDTCWNPKEPGIYRRILTKNTPHSEENPLAVYVYYAGNMADSVKDVLNSELKNLGLDPNEDRFRNSLVVEYRGLMYIGNTASQGKISNPITYTTETDNTALLSAANAAAKKSGTEAQTALFDVTLTNSASCGMWNSAGKSSVTETVKRRISALLSIQKTAAAISKNAGDDAYTGKYTLNVVNGLTASDYIEVEDFISGFANVTLKADGSTSTDSETSYTDEPNQEAVQKLVKHLLLTGVTIKIPIDGKESTTVYENGNFTSEWEGSTFAFASDSDYTSENEKAGSLFTLRLVKNDAQIPAGTEFIISYDATLKMDTPVDGETFRQSDYYTGGGLQINNNAVASRTYDDSGSSTKVRSRLRAAAVTTQNSVSTLTVDCGSNVESVYLNKNKLYKVNSESGNTTNWMYYTYTGTMGKDGVEVTLTDAIAYDVDNSLTFTDSETGKTVKLVDLSEAEQTRVRTLVEHLVERHTTFSNIRVYYTDTKPDKNTLSEDKLIWNLGEDFAIYGGTEVTGGTATKDGLKDLTFGTPPMGVTASFDGKDAFSGITLTLNGTPATLGECTAEDGTRTLNHGHAGFTITAKGLDYDKYLVSTYDTTVDWAAVQEEITEILGNYSAKGRFDNEVSDDFGEKADSHGSTITVEDATLTKAVANINKTKGTADWTLTARTGSKSQNEMTLTDTAVVQLPEGVEDRVKTAAEAAVSIDPASVTIKQGNKTLYEKGAAAEGLTDNVSVTVDKLHLTVTVKNTEGSAPLQPNQTYTVTYSTRMDMDAFLDNGGKSEDTFTLANSAAFTYGNLKMTDTGTAEFEPELPIRAEKTAEANGNTVTWTARASTGEAARKEFTLRDTLSASDDVLAAMMLQSMQVEVETSENESEAYSFDDLLKGVSGITLTTSEGRTPELDKLGFGGFVLTFDSLPANTTVNVKYVTAVDREVYGKDEKLNLKNALNVSSADGAADDAESTAEIEVKKPFEKAGKVTTEGRKSYIDWTINVNLTQQFTQTQLDEMKEVTITDDLSPVLKLVDSSVTLEDPTSGAVSYSFTTVGNKLTVKMANPKEHPSVVLTFRTECLAGVDSLVNQAELSVDGTVVKKEESPDIGKVKVAGQYGTIQSAKIPTFTPTAWKYVDNELCTEADKYQFTITEVDENGSTVDGGYTETIRNDGEGKIPFSTIKYTKAGTRYYTVKEVGEGTLDTRVFTVEVKIQKVTGGYVVGSTILSPENYEEIRFDNTTLPKTTDFTVRKIWNDQENAANLRPAEIIVYLYQGDQPYNNMAVTLNESNHWTYTWKDLPVAGGDYHAVENPVSNYEGTAVTKDGETVLTNTVLNDKPEQPDDKKPEQPDDNKPSQPDDKKPDQPDNSKHDSGNHNKKSDTSNTSDRSGSADSVAQTPATGDTANLTLWFALVGVSLLGVLLFLLKIRRDKRNRQL